MYILYLLLSPLRKGRALRVNKLEPPSPKNVLVAIAFGSVELEKKGFTWKY